MVHQKEKVMDQNQKQFIAQQFKEKYAEELDTKSGLRRRFSSAFRTDLVIALEESGGSTSVKKDLSAQDLTHQFVP